MSTHCVIIGGVALGPKVASRLKRCAPETKVTLLDRDRLISYGGCGIPYFVGGDVQDVTELRKTMYHMERNEEFFKKVKHFDVLTGKEVVSINRRDKYVTYRDVDTGVEKDLSYDTLVLATGTTPVLPPLPGTDLSNVFTVANLHHAQAIKEQLTQGAIESAVIVGGGAIGLEMAESFADLWGVETTVVEMLDQALPQAIGPDMAGLVQKQLEDNEVRFLAGTKVTEVIGDPENRVKGVKTTAGEIPCQAVIFSVGVRPNTSLAAEAGLSIGANHGIVVNARLRTSDPYIYAGGDCIEQRHLISGESLVMPLGSLANRQGRVIANNIAGGNDQFKGVIGNFCVKLFDIGVARAGLTVRQAEEAGFDPEYALVVQPDRAHFYPTSAIMYLKLIADKKTRQVLGVEALGPNGDAVKARVDAIAAVLPYKIDCQDISNLEVCYSPPYASAMDIVNVAGNVLQNILDGLNQPIFPQELADTFPGSGAVVLDVRHPDQARFGVEKYKEQWLNIPLEEIPDRMEEVPRDKPVHVYCNTGTRSYEVQRYLNAKGWDRVSGVQGSYAVLKNIAPDLDERE
ncbi:MAG: FAD-dependent oxidoreductase [Desulfohalobiaceae bacterium]|nr:FAD-dependent oxidoreductase [Desulfohalobiaceae bacterium]